MWAFTQKLPAGSWATFGLLTLCFSLFYIVSKLLVRPFFSPLRDLPGPASPSLLFGHLKQIFKAQPGEQHERWVDEYGPTLVYKGLFNQDQILTLDTKAMSYVLNHSYGWQKPGSVRNFINILSEESVFFVEGDFHKRQRRAMNPSFSTAHLRELTGIFHVKSAQLRDIWLTQSAENGGSCRVDVLDWMGKATLDIIGLAGFDYEFNALNPNGEENELNKAFMALKQYQGMSIFKYLQAFFPLLHRIPTKRSRGVADAQGIMSRVGLKLIDEKKRAILAMASNDDKNGPGMRRIEKRSVTTRDLLSLLMIANMATDVPESQRLSDEIVLAQISSFLAAGDGTISNTATWCLYALSCDPAMQTNLREELFSLSTSTPSMDELNTLPYLDAVVRETLRLYAPPASVRAAMKDDILPLGTPFKDRKGRLRHEIRVKKGDLIDIPILLFNTCKEFWGEDAHEFRPQRWQHLPEKVGDIPGIHSGLMSFLGGPRACIGYRFALTEFKTLIFTLVRAFAFEPADPSYEIVPKLGVLPSPIVKSEPQKGPQLPLRVTPWRGA